MTNEVGEDWAWVGEQKFATFKAFRSDDIRFVTLQDARAALGEERARIREKLLNTFDREWRCGCSSKCTHVDDLTRDDLVKAMDRICPEDA